MLLVERRLNFRLSALAAMMGLLGFFVWRHPSACGREIGLTIRQPAPTRSSFGVRYLGFYGVSDAGVLSHHGNLIFTVSSSDVERAARFGIKAFHHVGGSLTSADDKYWPEALTQWQRTAESIRPYISNVAAFYLYDEPYGQLRSLGRRVAYQRLQRAAMAIRQRFPGIPIAIAEAADNVTGYYSGQAYSVPPEIDWVGFDCYDGTFADCGASHKSIPEFLALVKVAIDPSKQRTFLIPPSFYLMSSKGGEREILSAIRHGGPCSAPPTCRVQDSLVAISRQYFALAKSDPTVVAVMGFTGGLYEESNNLFLGGLDMPGVRAAYDEFFRSIPGNNAASNVKYPTGTQIVSSDRNTQIRPHFPGDTVWPAVEILNAQNTPQLGVNVECTPSQGSKVLWRARATGTNDPANAFFGWALGPLPRHTYTLHCQSPATGSLSVTFSATTKETNGVSR